ncbi:MAG: rod shape-determining protein RodA [Rhodobiaceae bacterium]|nr:MAG: rod shape-determining protein RodA [Rhodobiaceae bacterium]
MVDAFFNSGGGREMKLRDKFFEFNWGFLLLICAIASMGIAMLYSVAEGSFDPWASRQAIRFGAGLVILFVVAFVDIKVWMSLAYPAFGVALLLLIAVEFVGFRGMGAQRWIDFGVIQLQPSELIKITLILALARYFHGLTLDQVSRIRFLIVPAVMIALPFWLTLRQPDLGTAVLIVVVGVTLLFMAGLAWRYFVLGGIGVIGAVPVAWSTLHDYQRQRVLTFLDPESDPLGAGYHILQSKIALGSGGVFGKGFMEGTQSHLSFLPEKHTDFIFTMLAEELGLVGGLTLLGLYFMVLMFGITVGLQTRNQFGRLLAMGITINFFLYVFINIAMVMGLLPVVGVPLPLVSYGGTAMLTLMLGFGLLMSVYIHRNQEITRTPAAFW